MSSLARTRSLRKPAGPTALPPRERFSEQSQPDPSRNLSPSRLLTKPASRPTTNSSTTATTPARSTSGRLHRKGSGASSDGSFAATTPTGPKRSVSLGKKTVTTAAAAATAAQGHTPARRDTHRYPPRSSATRPTSMVLRPTSAGSTGSAPTATRRTTPTHARANSTAGTGAGSAPPAAASQERKSRSRPPSRDPISPVAATPAMPKRRAVSADKRPLPPTTPNKTTAAAPPPSLQHRPAFNTLQQRFSPAKTDSPKLPTASYTQPSSSPSKLPANVAASAETARLQAELLQLHFLHRDAGKVESQWHASAKTKLGLRFHELRDAHRALADREAAAVEADNLQGLQRWGGALLDAKIRSLDAAISGVWAMSEPGGKYARVVRRFERWVERVMDLEEARDNGTIGLLASGGGGGSITLGSSTGSGGGAAVEDALFVPELDPAWADDCESMARKLEDWRDQLEGACLKNQHGGAEATMTSLGRMLDGARSLVRDMLAELSAMEEIRQAALARQEDWIEAMNRDDDESDIPLRAGAVWRAI
ncbi:hypothetical protein MY11210_005072 [Beauveria gryllotalpidicola]